MATQISIIAGLGNPEDRYAGTLHNAGFWFADELARRDGAQFKYEKRFDADVCKIQASELHESEWRTDSRDS
jgi:PTH1 family peptidyl-tRNA hydrolase